MKDNSKQRLCLRVLYLLDKPHLFRFSLRQETPTSVDMAMSVAGAHVVVAASVDATTLHATTSAPSHRIASKLVVPCGETGTYAFDRHGASILQVRETTSSGTRAVVFVSGTVMLPLFF